MMSNEEIKKSIASCLSEYGLPHHQWIPLERPLSFEFYRQWIAQGHHGEMTYLKNHLSAKDDPQKTFPTMKSAIMVTVSYQIHPKKTQEEKLPNLKIARYVGGEDYHFWLKKKLDSIATQLNLKFPGHSFLTFTDSVPFMERDQAHRAGLGWIGKNTCLIHPKRGSFLFIGEILSSIPAESFPTSVPDFCGTCRRCLDACPTQAIQENKTLIATQCLSYWNIEAKSLPPENIREAMGHWFFGCDICQDVCPWNIKLQKLTPQPESFQNGLISEKGLCDELQWILSSSNKELMRQLKHSPLSRARGRGLKRNAMIVAANLRLTALKATIEPFLEDPSLKEIAQWTWDKLNTPSNPK